WVTGYFLVGILAIVATVSYGKSRTIDSYVWRSAIPASFVVSCLMLLGIMWWPSAISIELFSTMLTMAVAATVWPLSAVGGILALNFFIFQPLKWAYS